MYSHHLPFSPFFSIHFPPCSSTLHRRLYTPYQEYGVLIFGLDRPSTPATVDPPPMNTPATLPLYSPPRRCSNNNTAEIYTPASAHLSLSDHYYPNRKLVTDKLIVFYRYYLRDQPCPDGKIVENMKPRDSRPPQLETTSIQEQPAATTTRLDINIASSWLQIYFERHRNFLTTDSNPLQDYNGHSQAHLARGTRSNYYYNPSPIRQPRRR
jgi:hypothetical protein